MTKASYPKVLPFKATRYDSYRIQNMGEVVSPPYDVIDPSFQQKLYQRSPYNFVRVDFNQESPQTKYVVAKKTYEEWITSNLLIQEGEAAFYLHHQIFTLPDGKKITRKGFFAARRVEDFSEGGIKPHEKTLEGPKADRLELTRALEVNLSPVFSLYSDPQKKIDELVNSAKKQKPLYEFNVEGGEFHQLWKLTDKSLCQQISAFLQEQPIFIADGHHRYETAINYRNECRKKHSPGSGLEAFNYVLMYLTNKDDEGMIILPIHRALHGIKNLSLETLLTQLKNGFKLTQLKNQSNEDLLEQLHQEGKKTHAFVLITSDPSCAYLVSLDHALWQQHPIAKSIPQSLRGLDVTVLHRLIFEDILGISQEAQAKQENIIYWKDTTKAINETRQGNCDFTFLLNATKIEQMEKVALAGEKMPQKSTFFYPKIVSGLVINPLDPKIKLGY